MSSKIIWLSHPLSTETPSYGGGEGMRIEPITTIATGDTANTSRFVLPNHLGTHVDIPKHFFDSGSSLTDYPPDFWVFDNPMLVDVPGDDGYLISPKDVEGKITPETDILLLRTGYEKYRGDSRYWEHNPGLHPELGTWLRKGFPNMRILGMDIISITSRHHREEGRAAHRTLLDPDKPGKPLVAIEDMALSQVCGQLNSVIIVPLRVSKANGGPCTVIGFIS